MLIKNSIQKLQYFRFVICYYFKSMGEINFDAFFSQIHKINHFAQHSLTSKFTHLFVGVDGSGKKSFIDYLSGKKLILAEKEQIYQLVPQEEEHKSSSSQTYGLSIKIHSFYDSQNEIALVSLPWVLKENKKPSNLFLNLYGIKAVLSQLKQIQINILLPYELTFDTSLLMNFFQLWESFVQNEEKFSKLSKATNLIFTKIENEDDKDDFIVGLKDISEHQSENEKQLSSFLDALQSQRFHLFYNAETQEEEGAQLFARMNENENKVHSGWLNIKKGLNKIEDKIEVEEKKEFMVEVVERSKEKTINIIKLTVSYFYYLFINKSDDHKEAGDINEVQAYLVQNDFFKLSQLKQKTPTLDHQDYEDFFLLLKQLYQIVFLDDFQLPSSFLASFLSSLPAQQLTTSVMEEINNLLELWKFAEIFQLEIDFKSDIKNVKDILKKESIQYVNEKQLLAKLTQVDEEIKDDEVFSALLEMNESFSDFDIKEEPQGRFYMQNPIQAQVEGLLKQGKKSMISCKDTQRVQKLLRSLEEQKGRGEVLNTLFQIFRDYCQLQLSIRVLIEINSFQMMEQYISSYENQIWEDSSKTTIILDFLLPYLHSQISQFKDNQTIVNSCGNIISRCYNSLMMDNCFSQKQYEMIREMERKILEQRIIVEREKCKTLKQEIEGQPNILNGIVRRIRQKEEKVRICEATNINIYLRSNIYQL